MRKLLAFVLAFALLLGVNAFADTNVRFKYVYNSFYVYDPGTQVYITAQLEYPANVTAQLKDSDGTVLGEKEFTTSNTQRPFAFNIPEDWTGCHMLALYVDGEKCSDDFPVFVKEHEKTMKRVDITEKKMAITIDCGAGGAYECAKWIELLKKYDANATFFVTGMWAERNPDAVRAIHEAGFEIGNHSYNHPHCEKITDWSVMVNELQGTNDLIEELTGVRPTLFRVPYGDWSYTMNTICKWMGFEQTVQWNMSAHDAENYSVNQMLTYSMPKEIKPGSIVLFHCASPALDQMDKVFDYYVNTMGFELVSVSELLPEGETYIDDDFVLHTK